MEVVNPRAALLSNFEVLTLLRELESEQLAETRAALAIKKERSESGHVESKNHMSHQPPIPEVCENLRTVEFEAIAHLSADFQPINRQTAHGIRKLTKGLAPFKLTKGEKLQIVNLAPTQPVELYVIVEELEDRLSDRMDDILTLVRDTLTDTPEDTEADAEADATGDWEYQDQNEVAGGEIVGQVDTHADEDWDDSGIMEFIDNEGDFEGDLDADDADD
ncbi:RNA polymerase Rpb4-domain-containing protein [Hysterangium stoloniferum]|nr:RNA polymerase Rpb4-domain-containing protein [Hysterangium stoloniferum]